jgi:hypothetical protein
MRPVSSLAFLGSWRAPRHCRQQKGAQPGALVAKTTFGLVVVVVMMVVVVVAVRPRQDPDAKMMVVMVMMVVADLDRNLRQPRRPVGAVGKLRIIGLQLRQGIRYRIEQVPIAGDRGRWRRRRRRCCRLRTRYCRKCGGGS